MSEVAVPAGIVVIPADQHGRFPRHEAWAAPCRLAPAEADPVDSGAPLATAPDLAQLWRACSLGLVTAGEPERTRTVLAPRDAIALARDTGAGFYEIQLTADGPRTVTPLSGPARLRRARGEGVPPRWVRAVRPCVARDGRGRAWPVSRLVRAGARTAEPVMVDGAAPLVCVHVDAGWSLVAVDTDSLPLGWVPAAALVPEEDARVAPR